MAERLDGWSGPRDGAAGSRAMLLAQASEKMNPEHGGKIELRLESATSDSAQYAAELRTPGATFLGRARVGSGAGPRQVEFDAFDSPGGAPPEWLAADARAALKAALRTAQAEGRWPRRITRWRPEPRD